MAKDWLMGDNGPVEVLQAVPIEESNYGLGTIAGCVCRFLTNDEGETPLSSCGYHGGLEDRIQELEEELKDYREAQKQRLAALKRALQPVYHPGLEKLLDI